MGLQCLHLENQTVHGFSGTDSEGVPWQLFFDSKTKKPIYGVSGAGDPNSEDGSTQVELYITAYKPVGAFGTETATEFLLPKCLQDYQFDGVA